MASSPNPATAIWPPDPLPVGYISRKAFPIKRNDAEPLNRDDVQYDLLHCIFSDSRPVFTNTNPRRPAKVTFAELYVSAIYNSSKCSKVVREKMMETPAFATELAKISLLTNVGRINTTMAFFPEMKTALRTYHPVPSLQRTDGNAQDAPRIKNCLKAVILPSELNIPPPSTPEEVLVRNRAGLRPPTTVVNLLFILANHATPLANVHFDGTLNFLDLFLPNTELFSVDRANVFLWLAYHYLEDPDSPNPYDDSHSRQFSGKAPFMRQMSESQAKLENVDTPEEIAWGKNMSNQRNAFLQKLVNSIDNEKRMKAPVPHFVAEPHNGSSGNSHIAHSTRLNRAGPAESRDEAPFMHYIPQPDAAPPTQGKKNPLLRLRTRPPHPATLPLVVSQSQPRTMLQHAWHTVCTTDSLADSDEEIENGDEHARVDYTRRVGVLTNIMHSDFFRDTQPKSTP